MESLLILLCLVPCVHSSHLPSPDKSAYTSLEPNDLQRTLKVQIAMLTCSGISMTASLLAFCWFCRMERQFRHQWVFPFRHVRPLTSYLRLIMLLLYGDLTRATWYLVFAAVSLGQGTVKTKSSFCQGSGFFMQYGETTSGE
jgi:G protein-coupled receptor GPR1